MFPFLGGAIRLTGEILIIINYLPISAAALVTLLFVSLASTIVSGLEADINSVVCFVLKIVSSQRVLSH